MKMSSTRTPLHLASWQRHGLARLGLFSALLLVLGGLVQAQSLGPGPAPAVNPQADPFAVSPPPMLPPPPPGKLSAVPLPALPPAPAASPVQPLPTGLRAILIRDNGQGLLSSADANAYSIPVTHGKLVRLGEQDYRVEVTATAIRLYASPRDKLVWEGTLGAPAPLSLPADTSQLRFIPPLSAGVSPGLRSGGAQAGSAAGAISTTAD